MLTARKLLSGIARILSHGYGLMFCVALVAATPALAQTPPNEGDDCEISRTSNIVFDLLADKNKDLTQKLMRPVLKIFNTQCLSTIVKALGGLSRFIADATGGIPLLGGLGALVPGFAQALCAVALDHLPDFITQTSGASPDAWPNAVAMMDGRRVLAMPTKRA